MKIKKILWATDGSAEAEFALKFAKYLAAMAKAEIIGVHVIPLPVQLLFQELREEDAKFSEWQSRAEKKVTSRFGTIKKNLEKDGIKFEGVILKGIPNEQICEFSDHRKADIVIMGKHGHGLIETMLIGSETVKVLQNSHIPVFVAKGAETVKKAEFKNILVPVDMCHDTESALHMAMDLSLLTGCSITAIYALRLDMYAQDMPAGALDIVIKQSVSELEKRVATSKEKFQSASKTKLKKEIKTEVIHGLSPAVSISNYARKNKMDLIVINTHGRTGISRLVLGSVTERLIPESPCSVLALKPE